MEELSMVLMIFAVLLFGVWIGVPDENDIHVGSKSGCVCAEVGLATEAGDEAKCAVYKLEEPND